MEEAYTIAPMRYVKHLPVLLFLALLALLLDTSRQATATEVGGVICEDTVWNLGSSPFVAATNILICEGVTLTIKPGVVVQLNGKGVRVDGTLVAKGTQTRPIIFTGGHGISFTALSADAVFDGNGAYQAGSILQFCAVDGGGIEALGSSPFIDHCIVQNGAPAGIRYTCSGAK